MKRQILTCIWKNINKNKCIIDIVVPVRLTRAALAPTIHLPIPRTEIFKKSVFYYGATLWNQLPQDTRLQENILYDNFDKLNSTSSIFVDYSKAFDMKF